MAVCFSNSPQENCLKIPLCFIRMKQNSYSITKWYTYGGCQGPKKLDFVKILCLLLASIHLSFREHWLRAMAILLDHRPLRRAKKMNFHYGTYN